METLKERALAFADDVLTDADPSDMLRRLAVSCNPLSAKEECVALLRWHDPKEELPDYYHAVLVKYLKDGLYHYAVAWLSVNDDDEYSWVIDETNVVIRHRNVHFWRPIIEAGEL